MAQGWSDELLSKSCSGSRTQLVAGSRSQHQAWAAHPHTFHQWAIASFYLIGLYVKLLFYFGITVARGFTIVSKIHLWITSPLFLSDASVWNLFSARVWAASLHEVTFFTSRKMLASLLVQVSQLCVHCAISAPHLFPGFLCCSNCFYLTYF